VVPISASRKDSSQSSELVCELGNWTRKRGQVMLRDCSLKKERDIFLVNSSTLQKIITFVL
jgi:hypothetical protein